VSVSRTFGADCLTPLVLMNCPPATAKISPELKSGCCERARFQEKLAGELRHGA
jgi:hypothetical protein